MQQPSAGYGAVVVLLLVLAGGLVFARVGLVRTRVSPGVVRRAMWVLAVLAVVVARSGGEGRRLHRPHRMVPSH